MTDISVSSTAALLSALAAAQGGDVILLQPGTYSGVLIQNLNFATGVQITSADAGHPATLLDLTVRASSGLQFSNLEFNAAGSTAYYPFQVADSSNVHFSHLYVHGSLNDDPKDDTSGLLIRESNNVSVTDSEFEQLSYGINHLNTDHLTISGSSFHDLRSDGIRGGGSSYVTIHGNSFTDFYPIDSDHPDGIQFWTTSSTVVPHHIVITDNVIVRGTGVAMQGIFMRDEVGTLHYQDVTITGNMIVGAQWNGITVMGGATRLTVSNNEIAGLPDQQSWLRLEDVTDSVISQNRAGDFIQVRNSGLTWTSNTIFAPTADQANQLLQTWLVAHPGMAELLADGQVAQAPSPPSMLVMMGTEAADDLVAPSTGPVEVVGLGGNDKLTGGAGDQRLEGGLGDDSYFVTDARNRTLEAAGEGIDTVTSSIDFSLASNLENLRLSGSALRGYGNELDNLIYGTTAANVLDGEGGADNLRGGAGDDVYGVDDLLDRIVEVASEGVDRVNSSVDHVLGANVENLRLYGTAAKGYGNELANQITGNESANTLVGLEGVDTLSGAGGDDRVYGGADNDQLRGGDGDDLVSGETGADRAYGEDGNDRLYGDDGADILFGGAGLDMVYGGTGNDQMRGDDGDDVVSGGADVDRLYGDAGSDRLYGDEGNDLLFGGAGQDFLTGGAGKDRFVFENTDSSSPAAFDTILDFGAGDSIDLKQIDANLGTSRNEAFKFIGKADFSGVAGQLNYHVEGSNAYICGDVNGDGVADFTICVAGVTSLTSSDFLL
jgi:Ca2+-binding RTX toxin-like protein